MNRSRILLALLFWMTVFCASAQAQSAGDYRSIASGLWVSTFTWERFDGSSWVGLPSPPISSDGVITIRSGHIVEMTATVVYDQVVVEAGGQVTIAAGITHTLNDGPGTDLSISGTWLNQGGTWTVSAAATWSVNAGGTYVHNTTSGISTPLNSAMLDPASSFIYRGSSTLTPASSFSGRTYGMLSLESTPGNWTASASGTGTLTINGDFTIGSGVSYSTTQTGVMTFAGNFTNNGTLTNSTGTQVYTFTGVGKTIGGGGAISFETWNVIGSASITLSRDVSIGSGFTATISGTLNCGTQIVSGAGFFSLASGATLGVGSPSGVATSGATGNIQNTGGRQYGPGANFVYNGSAAQMTGNALNATNLTISNPAGVTLSLGTSSITLAVTSGAMFIVPSGLSYQCGGTTVVVDGTISGAGQLNILGTTFTNNGTVSTSLTRFTGTTIDGNGLWTGSTLRTEGSATTRISNDMTMAVGTLTSIGFSPLALQSHILTFTGANLSAFINGPGTVRTQGTVSTTGSLAPAPAFEVVTGTTTAVDGATFFGPVTVASGATLQVAAGGTVTTSSTVTVNGTLNGADGASILFSQGSLFTNNGAVAVATLQFSNALAATVAGSGTWSGASLINGISTLSLGTSMIFSVGTLTNNATIALGVNTLTFAGSTINAGDMTSSGGLLRTQGTVTLNAPFFGAPLRVNTGTTTATGTFNNTLTVDLGATLNVPTSTTLVATTAMMNGSLTGADSSSVFRFAGSLTNNSNSVSIANVQVVGGSTLTGAGSFQSPNTITLLGGNSLTLGSDHQVHNFVANGVLDLSSFTLCVTGDFTVNAGGGLTGGGGTLAFCGSTAQTMGGDGAVDLLNLTVNNGAGVTLMRDLTVNGALNLQSGDLTTGAFTLTMPDTAASTGTFDVIGRVKRLVNSNIGAALSFGNPFNTITFTDGSPPDDITVTLAESSPADFGNAVRRTYTITPSGGGAFTATLRLRYEDSQLNGNSEPGLQLWRFDGAVWTSQSPTSSDTANNWIEKTGVTAFSRWTLAAGSPTDISLISFTAAGHDDEVRLQWETGFEVDNLGFNIYRDENGERIRVNPEVIGGSALVVGPGIALDAGRSYEWWDGQPRGKQTAYWLEEIDLGGKSIWHGPVFSSPVDGPAANRQAAILLSNIGLSQQQQAPRASRQVEKAAPLVPTSASAFAGQASLASDRALKISIKREGWYRITQREVIAAGLDPRTDPRTLQLFVHGLQQPISVTGESDGRLDADDALEFYGTGIESPSTDTRVYWLVAGEEFGQRIKLTKRESGYPGAASFPFTVERRDRSVYFSALRNGETENFFGAVITVATVKQAVAAPAVDHATADEATLEVALQGVTRVPHQVQISLNGTAVGTLLFASQSNARTTISVPIALVNSENEIALTSRGGPSDISLVDYIRLTYRRIYRAENNWLRFSAQGNQQVTIDGFGGPDIRVVDVTHPNSVSEVAGSVKKTDAGYAMEVTSPGTDARSLLAFAADAAMKAVDICPNRPSTWRKRNNRADLVIISHRSLTDSLARLKQFRESQRMSVALVDVEDVYDEFSYGHKTPKAIKDFLTYARSWKKTPRFVLLAGDASYDPKNYLGRGDWDLVPTALIDTDFMEAASDDALADTDGDGIADAAIGRLPVRDAQQADDVVSKIIGRETSTPKDGVLLISDLGDGFDFEGASAQLRPLVPETVKVTELTRGVTDDSTLRSQVVDSINSGQLIVNYTGHGSLDRWRGALMTSSDAGALANHERLPLFVLMTCLNGYFNDPALDSLAEALITAKRGGAVAVWASSGMTVPANQAVMNQAFYRALFGSGSTITLGEAVNKAKLAVTDPDVRRTWVLFGDPTTRLK